MFLVLVSCSLLASANTVWHNPTVYTYDDGSQLGLYKDATATFEETERTGVLVSFTDFTLGEETLPDFNVALTSTNIELEHVSCQSYISAAVYGLGQIVLYPVPDPYAVYVDGQLRTENNGYTYDYLTQTLTINSATANFIVAYTTGDLPYPPNTTLNYAIDNTLVAALIVAIIPFIALIGAFLVFLKDSSDPSILLKAITLTIIVSVCLFIIVMVAGVIQTALPPT